MIQVEEFRSRFSYDHETGVITRKTNDAKVKRWVSGAVAGSINGQGYREIKVDGKSIGAHRIAWALYYGEQPPEYIDHINRDPRDNRISNLRAATRSQNGANRTALSNNKTGIKGCYFVKSKAPHLPGRWRAQCRVGTKLVDLGRYLTIEEAQAAYTAFAQKAFAEYHVPA